VAESYRETPSRALRVLFCFGVTQSFFEQEPGRVGEIAGDITKAFEDLGGRFGLNVLGTMDDDELMVGGSLAWPWTCYILADAPDLETVTKVCNILREAEAGGDRLWRYLKVEARVGRPLFFGNS
jgi:hypothetical protein